MASVEAAWPDAEAVILTLLESVAPTVTITGDLEEDTIQVVRVGGADDGISDYPRIEVGCFAHTRARAWQMAEQCRQIILASRNTTVEGCLIDGADTVTPANQVPYMNQDVRHVVAQYEFEWRRPRA